MASDSGQRAKEDAAAFADLKAKLDEAKAGLKSLQDEANKDIFAKDPIKKARAEVQELSAAYRELARAQKEAAREAAAADKEASRRKAAIEKATGADNPLDKALSSGEGHASVIEGALSKGGDALATAAKAAAAAALAIGAAGVALVKSGVEFGVRSSADKEKQVAILDRLTHGQGKLAEEVSQGLAEQTGVSEEKTLERVKSLIGSKFGRGDTEAITRAAADIGEVKGEGSGEAFISLLEKTKELGAASEKSIKALASVGIEKSELYEGLKKTGETTEEVEARLKAGKVTADEFTRAATAAANKDFGGVAGKGLDATLNRIKIGFGDLFEDWDLSPLEEAGHKVEEVLKSDKGDDLKKAIGEVGHEVLDLVKNVSKDDIKHAFSEAAAAAHELAEDIRTARDAAQDLVKAGKDLGIIGESIGRRGGKHDVDTGDGRLVERYARPEDKAADEAAAAQKSGADVGKAYDDGLAKGLEANAGKPAAAAADVATGVDAAGRKALGVHSPSTVAEEVGGFYDKGLELGIDRHAGGPESAAARLAGRVSRAGVPSATAGGVGASGGAGAPSLTLSIQNTFQVAAGTPADMVAALREHEATATARAYSIIRQFQRDSRETGGPP